MHKSIKYLIVIFILFFIFPLYVNAEEPLGLYGFYIGQKFEDAVLNAKERKYTIECVNLIQKIGDDGQIISGSTIDYEKICTPKNTLNPLKPLKVLIDVSSELNNFHLNENDNLLINYYINQLKINYNSVKPKFFDMICNYENDTNIRLTLYSENGLNTYYVLAILLYNIEKATLPLILNKFNYNIDKLRLLNNSQNDKFYLQKLNKGGILFEEKDGSVSNIYIIDNFNIQLFLDNIKKDIENKIK